MWRGQYPYMSDLYPIFSHHVIKVYIISACIILYVATSNQLNGAHLYYTSTEVWGTFVKLVLNKVIAINAQRLLVCIYILLFQSATVRINQV